MKKLENLGKALSKADQKQVDGGIKLTLNVWNCDTTCPGTNSTAYCGNVHCPAWCDGYGGWINA